MADSSKKLKYDSLALGAVLGILSPVLFFTIYYFIRFSHMRLFAFFHYMGIGGILLPTLSLCVVPNLLIFFIFIWTKRDKSARGVLLATLLYTIVVAIMKSME